VKWLLTIFQAALVVLLAGCAITEQTPEDVSQKFQEGIQGKGHLVPSDQFDQNRGAGPQP
jgi:hypothetical protein